MKVNWIEIDNIKSYRQTTKVILNKDYNFVVGTNGSGKTTLLQILASALFTIYPHYTINVDSRGSNNERKIRFNQGNRNAFLPKSYGRESEDQKVSLELSFTDSSSKIITELKTYKEIFDSNLEYIKDKFWDQDNLLDNIDQCINYLESLSSLNFNFDFRTTENSIELESASITTNQKILHVLQYLEQFRMIYNRLYRDHKTELVVNAGFRLIYISSDRIPSFSSAIALGRSSEDEYLNNTSYNRYAEVSANLYNNGAFDYINQILNRIGEKVVYQVWEKKRKDPLKYVTEYKLLKETVKRILDMDFEVEIPHTPYENIKFSFLKGGNKINFENLSSGEKSLIYFLFTFANPDIKNSFILVDEAEIHLHGNMQDKLLDIVFNNKTTNQHFISTHSPKLINRLTISSVLRFYKVQDATRYINFKTQTPSRSNYDVIRLINSQNNEKIFFADKVLLVEGIKDRIFYEKLIEKITRDYDIKEIIEVVDVGGKMNIEFYKNYLDEIDLENYVIADFDFLVDLKKTELKDLIETSPKKIDELLKHKKSEDRTKLVELLEDFLQQDSKEGLEEMLSYLKTRGYKLKDGLSSENTALIKAQILDLDTKNIKIISAAYLSDSSNNSGELEDYLIGKSKSKNKENSVNNLVELLSKTDFMKQIINGITTESANELFRNLSKVIFNNSISYQTLINKYKV